MRPSALGLPPRADEIGKKGKKDMLTQEQKAAICEEYKDRKNKVAEIAERYGILRGQVAHIAVEGGGRTPRC